MSADMQTELEAQLRVELLITDRAICCQRSASAASVPPDLLIVVYGYGKDFTKMAISRELYRGTYRNKMPIPRELATKLYTPESRV